MGTDREWIAKVNEGVINNSSGTINIVGSSIGRGAQVNSGRAAPASTEGEGSTGRGGCDIGVLTVISTEARAVSAVLRGGTARRERLEANGLCFEEATILVDERRLKLVHLRSLRPGQVPAALAVGALLSYCSPAVLALTGIAGGIHPDVRLGDVVIGEEIISYDPYKETAYGVRRRGSTQPIPSSTQRAINRFFSQRGEPCQVSTIDPDGVRRAFGVFHGPIGSGSAVVATEVSMVREYLSNVNDKTLAVETEAAGASWALYERIDSHRETGWLVVRGISDLANADKTDSYHEVAAWRAARVLELLGPFLIPER